MNGETGDRLFFAVIYNRLNAVVAADRYRECVIYEVVVKDLSRDFLAEIAAQGRNSMRDYLHMCLNAIWAAAWTTFPPRIVRRRHGCTHAQEAHACRRHGRFNRQLLEGVLDASGPRDRLPTHRAVQGSHFR